MKKFIIGIYHDNDAETLANVVNTLSQASAWVGVTLDALYKAKHLHGVMKANGYKIELIENTEELKNAIL